MTPGRLPAPDLDGPRSVEHAIASRRSRRQFRPEPLSEQQIGQLLWATQGITGPEGQLRAAPSAMEAYPLELYVATAAGVDLYVPADHSVRRILHEDVRAGLRAAAHDQDSITSAPSVFVFAAVYERAAARLGPGSEPYVHMDLGHAAQNLLLQATALDLSGVPIAWLEAHGVREVLGLPADQVPLYLVPIGRQLS